MKEKKILLLLILVLVLLLGTASGLYTSLDERVEAENLAAQSSSAETPETPAEEPKKVPAPDFTVYDEEGNAVQLSDYFGKPIVLNCWASWCGPCQSEMPAFQEKYLELGDEVHFLMVNMTSSDRESAQRAKDFIKTNGYTFPVLYDTEASAAIAYGAFSLPITFFIDSDGYVVTYAAGAINSELLQSGIDMITE